MNLQAEPLKLLVEAIFAGIGCRQEESECVADHLIKANIAGYDSHGLIRVPTYVEWFNQGKVLPNRDLKLLIDTESMTVADGQRGFGQWLGKVAVELGIRKCLEHGVSVLGLRNCGHLGRVGHWSEMAVEAGVIGLHFVNSTGFGMFVVPAGGRDPRLSVNPISIGVPVADGPPVVVDISTAAVAEGRLQVARNAGDTVADGLILNAEGEPTNDPNEFYGPPRGAILPLGEHKGYGLGLVVELLAGAVAGGGCSAEGKSQLEQGMLGIYIDPAKLDTDDRIGPEIRRYLDFVKSSRPSQSGNAVRVPGDRAQHNKNISGATLNIDETTWRQVAETASLCGVNNALVDAVIRQ
jgi:uncharacterized oxidoreductase